MNLKYFEALDGGAKVCVTVVNPEGAWHLYNLITPGDLVRTKTSRKITNDGKATETRILRLMLRVLNVDYEPGKLRISGRNQTQCDAVPLQAHHTLEVSHEPPQEVEIIKDEWNGVLQQRLDDACRKQATSDTAALVMDNGMAQVCFISSSLIIAQPRIAVSVRKKRKGSSAERDKSIQNFFQKALAYMLQSVDITALQLFLLCSPARVGEEFMDFAQKAATRVDAPPSLATFVSQRAKVVFVKVSSGHQIALKEALQNPKVKHHMNMARAANDLTVWAEFERVMTVNCARCVYGVESVFRALQEQQVEHLMISDEVLRNPNPIARHFFTEVVSEAKEFGGTVHIFSSAGLAGESLTALGGVAAILLVPLPHLDDIEPDPAFVGSQVVLDYLSSRMASHR